MARSTAIGLARGAICRSDLHNEAALRSAVADGRITSVRTVGATAVAVITAALQPGHEWLLSELMEAPHDSSGRVRHYTYCVKSNAGSVVMTGADEDGGTEDGEPSLSAMSALLQRIAILEQQVAELRERALKQGHGPLEPA